MPNRILKARGLSFDGINDGVTIPTSISLEPEEFTAELLIYISDTGRGDFITKNDGYGHGWRIIWNVSGGKDFLFQVNLGGDAPAGLGTGAYALYNWYHVVVSYKSGSGMKLYINNSLEASNTASGAINYGTDEPLTLGIRGNGQFAFSGIIDHVRLYNRELTPFEIQLLYENPDAEVAMDNLNLWMKFREGQGNTAYDSSGYGNNGTISGARWEVEKALRTLTPERVLNPNR